MGQWFVLLEVQIEDILTVKSANVKTKCYLQSVEYKNFIQSAFYNYNHYIT